MGKDILVDTNILFYAFRYALGRRSYSPSIVVENIQSNINQISEDDIKAYINEISQCNDLGDAMDAQLWNDFKDYLEKELRQR